MELDFQSRTKTVLYDLHGLKLLTKKVAKAAKMRYKPICLIALLKASIVVITIDGEVIKAWEGEAPTLDKMLIAIFTQE